MFADVTSRLSGWTPKEKRVLAKMWDACAKSIRYSHREDFETDTGEPVANFIGVNGEAMYSVSKIEMEYVLVMHVGTDPKIIYRGRSLDDMVSAFGGDTCIAAPLPVKRYAGLIPLILGIGECI